MELERQNPHWEEGFSYSYPVKRDAFALLKEGLKRNWIIALFGMRRTGKTVLMKQIIDDVIKGGKDRISVFYYSFDESKEDFWEVIRAYEGIIGRRVGEDNLLIFDEIQKVENWGEKVKLLYDTSKAKILLTGSSSATVKKGAESLAGRVVEIYLPPLSFREFLRFKGKEWLYSSNLEEEKEREYLSYIDRPLPEIVKEDKKFVEMYLNSIINKVIYEDIPSLFPVEEEEKLRALFELIRSKPGLLADYVSLSSDIGVSRVTLSKYVTMLERSFLIRKLYNYSRNPFTSEKRAKKLYPYIPAFCKSEMAEKIESAVAFHTNARFFWREKNRWEVDFIMDKPLIAFEVKFRKEIKERDIKGLREFLKRFGGKGVVVSKDKKGRKDGLYFVPYYNLPAFLENMKS